MKSEAHDKDEGVSRRDFLSIAALATAALAGLGILAGVFRFFKSDARYEEAASFKIGKPENFPVGTFKKLDDKKVFIFSDDSGVYAISSVCTHLGCLVFETETGFQCPCHGSKYTQAGKVTSGPAPRGLPWYEITQDVDGSLVVDSSREVPAGTKNRFS